MAQVRASSGTVVQAEEPSWSSLEAVLGIELAGWFMWMYELGLDNGTRVDAYKHVTTRRYLHLAQTRTAFVYNLEGRYVPTDLAAAITNAFSGWERARPARRALLALEAVVASARDRAA
jgi:hypothetical protein